MVNIKKKIILLTRKKIIHRDINIMVRATFISMIIEILREKQFIIKREFKIIQSRMIHKRRLRVLKEVINSTQISSSNRKQIQALKIWINTQ